MSARLPTLPDDVLRMIFALSARERGAANIQRHWAGYRARVLVRRFLTMRSLRLFRDPRSDVDVFVRQSQL